MTIFGLVAPRISTVDSRLGQCRGLGGHDLAVDEHDDRKREGVTRAGHLGVGLVNLDDIANAPSAACCHYARSRTRRTHSLRRFTSGSGDTIHPRSIRGKIDRSRSEGGGRHRGSTLRVRAPWGRNGAKTRGPVHHPAAAPSGPASTKIADQTSSERSSLRCPTPVRQPLPQWLPGGPCQT